MHLDSRQQPLEPGEDDAGVQPPGWGRGYSPSVGPALPLGNTDAGTEAKSTNTAAATARARGAGRVCGVGGRKAASALAPRPTTRAVAGPIRNVPAHLCRVRPQGRGGLGARFVVPPAPAQTEGRGPLGAQAQAPAPARRPRHAARRGPAA